MPNVFFHLYQLDDSVSNFRVVGWYFSFYSNFKRNFCKQTVENLIRQFGPGLCFYLEFGVQVGCSEKGPGQTLVRNSVSEFISGLTLVGQVQSSEKGTGRNLVCQVWSSEKGMG